jgi:hypothetical protein
MDIDKFIVIVQQQINRPCGNYIKLNLSYLAFNLTNEHIGKLIDIINASKKAVKLELAGNKLNDTQAKLLASCHWIISLDLSNNQLTAQTAILLGANRHLQELDISHNLIQDEGMDILAKNGRLAILNATDNNLTDECTESLATNKNLFNLVLDKNKISDKGAEVLLSNANLLRLSIYKNAVSEQYINRLVEKNLQNKQQLLIERNEFFLMILLLLMHQQRGNPAAVFQLPTELFIHISSYLCFPSSKVGRQQRTGTHCTNFIAQNIEKYSTRLAAIMLGGNRALLQAKEKVAELQKPSEFSFVTSEPNLAYLQRRAMRNSIAFKN